MSSNNNPPSDELTVKIAGEPRELFMSFGLLHELLAVVRDLPSIALIAVDTTLRTDVLNAVFAGRDEKGRIIEPLDMNTLRISAADVLRVVEWVGSHLLDFFLVAIEGTIRMHEPHKERLAMGTSTPSGPGSRD